MTSKSRFFACSYIFALVCILIPRATPQAASESQKAAAAVEKYFSVMKSDLQSVADLPEMSSMRRAYRALQRHFREYPEIAALMQVNSKGKVINELVRNGRPGKKYRNVSSQSWFGEVARLKSYYGYIETRGGGVYLFWCEPIRLGNRSSFRSGGALVAKIDLRKALGRAARQITHPFVVTYEGKSIYSRAWKDAYTPQKTTLNLSGISNLALIGQKASIASQEKNEEKTAAAPAPQKSGETAAQKGAETSSPQAEAQGEPAPKTGNPLPIVIVIVLLVAAGVIITRVILGVQKKRHEQLLAELDGTESSSTQIGSGSYSVQSGTDDSRGKGDKIEEMSLEDSATVVMPAVQLQERIASERGGSSQDSYAAQGYGAPPAPPPARNPDASAQQPSYGAGSAAAVPDNAREGEVPVQVYRKVDSQLRAEYEQKLEQIVSQRSEQLKYQIYSQVRSDMQQKLATYLDQLDKRLVEIAQAPSSEQDRMSALAALSAQLRHMQQKLQTGE
jgi:hypothetical protein